MVGKIRREFSVESRPYTDLVLYEVSLDDLNQFEAETLTTAEDFSFALFSVTAAISFTITLATVDIAAGKLFDLFWLITSRICWICVLRDSVVSQSSQIQEHDKENQRTFRS